MNPVMPPLTKEQIEQQRENFRILMARTANLADTSHRIAEELNKVEAHACSGVGCEICSPEWKAKRLMMMVRELDQGVANFYEEEYVERA